MDRLMHKILPAALAGLLLLGPIGAATAGEATLLRVSAGEYGATQHVSVGLNKSMLIDLPADVKEVIVSQPGMANAVMRTKRRAFIQGTGAGETNIFFLDVAGNAIAVVDISVVTDSATLVTALRGSLAGSNIQVQNFGGRVVLTGTAQSADDVAKATEIAAQFTGSAESVANLVSADGGDQVMLKVTIAEVSRQTVKQLGINLSATYDGNGFSTSVLGPSQLPAASGAKLSFDVGGFSLSAVLNALNQNGSVRTLAEPTLTALSGQEAEFKAGGEFPVPVGYEDGKLTYGFKDFGVNLKFTPSVKSGGVVGLTVDTSVSELTTEGALSVNGVTIPATKNRSAKTSVELPAGSTLAIGGLLQDSLRQQINALPGLGNIPILGALFRSREYNRSQTELIILVTPYIARPTTAQVTLPTDNFVPAGDAEAIFLGHMEKLYSVGGDPNGALRGSLQGSVGFVLD